MRATYLGIPLENPLIVSAGPWSRNGDSIKKAFDAGVGAVVTESIVTEAKLDVRPRLAYDGKGLQNIRFYSDIQVEAWEEEMKIAKQNGGVVIASISGHTPSELAYLASKMERFGADAIEVSISAPMGEALEVMSSDPVKVFEITQKVVESVEIPVSVKLSQSVTNLVKTAKAVKKAKGSAITAINTIRCILGVDIETRRPSLPTYGGYSGAPIRPIGLASVATIAQSGDIEVCGVGGVENYKHVLEYIMLGASAVQIGTSYLVEGVKVLETILNELERWSQLNNVKHVSEIRGTALQKLMALDEIKIEPVVSKEEDNPCIPECKSCVKGCIYNAISIDIKNGSQKVHVDPSKCTGCGLCASICPINKLQLSWDS